MKKRTVRRIFCLLLLAISFVTLLTSCDKKINVKLNFIVEDELYASITTSGGNSIEMPADPEKSGFVFDGWYLDNDSWKKPFTANSLLNVYVSDNILLYAKWLTPDGEKGTQASFKAFKADENNELSLKVSNETKSLAIEPLISIDPSSSWVLATDAAGNNAVASKTATLSVGNNTYYALVSALDGSTQRYTLNIRRRPVYNVVFDSCGGASVETQRVEEDSLATEPTVTREGHTFVAWDYDFTRPITESTVIKASWTPLEYTITLNANGGSVESTTSKIQYGKKYTLESPTREYYEFLGWYYEDKLVDSNEWNIPSNATLVAKWQPWEYTISYSLNGGTLDGNNPTVYTVESKDITLISPTKTGYIFTGWTGTELTAPTTAVTIPAGSVGHREYVANWAPETYAITYNLNGGSNDSNNPTAYTIESEDISLAAPTRTGYTFAGWYTSESFAEGSEITLIFKGSVGALSVYAKWTAKTVTVTLYDLINFNPTFTVSFDLNGASGTAPAAQTVTKTVALTYPEIPTRDGYVFTGWYTTPSCTEEYDFSDNITSDITLYAGWVAYSITSSDWEIVNGVLQSTNKSDYSSSSYKITAPCPIRISFSYKTSSEANYDKLYIKKNGNILKTTSGSTSYVSYSVDLEAEEYLTFEYSKDGSESKYADCAYISNLTITSIVSQLDGGVITDDILVTKSLTYDQAFTLDVPTKEDYAFAGWYDGEGGTGTQYTDATGAGVRTWDKETDTVLYAKWEEIAVSAT